MIVATAGHIDHGKTALVRALTGVDTDRLPEEKARGITIDLGFAYLPLPGGGSIGFVDVPGHERLVRTMMAGASGVDMALLVVAADDGVMPQTREHVAVLDLMGVRRCLVALTKSDRAGADRIAAVSADVDVAIEGTSLAGATMLPCSSLTGDGIAALLSKIQAEAADTAERSAAGGFRLAVDRSFTLPGIGLIATGVVHAGSVRAGDRLLVSPAGIEARVRGLHAQDRPAECGRAGERVALNLAGPGVDRGSVRRGEWIVTPRLHRPTTRLDVRLRLLPSEARALKHWTAVHLHVGTSSVTARVGLAAPLPPGGEAVAQLVLDAPVAALWGDRFAVRDTSAQRTIGGGVVLDPFAPQRRGRERPEVLAACALQDHGEAFAALLDAMPAGLDAEKFRLARNLDEAACDALTATAASDGRLSFSRRCWADMEASLMAALRQHHTTHPESWGATAEELAAALPTALRGTSPALLRVLLDLGLMRRTGRLLHVPEREVRLSASDAVVWEALRAVLEAADLDPLRVGVLAKRLGVEVDAFRSLLDRLGRLGWLCRISANYFLLPGTVDRFADAVAQVAAESPDQLCTVGRFRDATGISRHATMPLLEFFDHVGLTRRLNEGRRVSGTGWRADTGSDAISRF